MDWPALQSPEKALLAWLISLVELNFNFRSQGTTVALAAPALLIFPRNVISFNLIASS